MGCRPTNRSLYQRLYAALLVAILVVFTRLYRRLLIPCRFDLVLSRIRHFDRALPFISRVFANLVSKPLELAPAPFGNFHSTFSRPVRISAAEFPDSCAAAFPTWQSHMSTKQTNV
jgi:hypothetical protein